jgi:hypothetical protein
MFEEFTRGCRSFVSEMSKDSWADRYPSGCFDTKPLAVTAAPTVQSDIYTLVDSSPWRPDRLPSPARSPSGRISDQELSKVRMSEAGIMDYVIHTTPSMTPFCVTDRLSYLEKFRKTTEGYITRIETGMRKDRYSVSQA